MASQPISGSVPHIIALCMQEHFIEALQEAISSYQLTPSVSFTFHDSALSFVPSSSSFEAIVSPANSYGRLDGGFDDAISRAFSPQGDYLALTRAAQAKLYDEWRGFAPPGTCTILRIPDEFHAQSKNVWGTKYLALCPTMRVPQDVTWDREIVYESMWSLLCAIDKHNRSVQTGKSEPGEEEIRSILMVPMAAGTGRVSAAKWAAQVALAIKHYVDAIHNPGKWSALEHDEIFESVDEVAETWAL